MAEEENEQPQAADVEETTEAPEAPALEGEAEEYAEAQADTAETEEAVEDAEAAAPAAPARPEPDEVLAPKERRRRKRAAKEPAVRGPLSHEERQAERDARGAKKAPPRRGQRLKDRAAKPAGEAVAPIAIEHAVGRPKARQG